VAAKEADAFPGMTIISKGNSDEGF